MVRLRLQRAVVPLHRVDGRRQDGRIRRERAVLDLVARGGRGEHAQRPRRRHGPVLLLHEPGAVHRDAARHAGRAPHRLARLADRQPRHTERDRRPAQRKREAERLARRRPGRGRRPRLPHGRNERGGALARHAGRIRRQQARRPRRRRGGVRAGRGGERLVGSALHHAARRRQLRGGGDGRRAVHPQRRRGGENGIRLLCRFRGRYAAPRASLPGIGQRNGDDGVAASFRSAHARPRDGRDVAGGARARAAFCASRRRAARRRSPGCRSRPRT